jgi:prephenate dehydrogenase
MREADVETTQPVNSTPQQRVGIVGLGLIGGSIGLALRDPSREIIGCDSDSKAERTAISRFCVDRTAPLAEVAKCQVVFIAVPPGSVVETAERVLEVKGPDTVLTDCSSVKTEVASWAERKRVKDFVPGHPMAGHEKGGAEYASAWLFRDARWILTPHKQVSSAAVSRVDRLVRQTGAIPVRLDPAHHDRHVAILSHLPHALAALLVVMGGELDHLEVAAGSWRDVTRVGGVDPELWTQILMGNRIELSNVLEEFGRSLDSMREILNGNEGATMKKLLEVARVAKVKQDQRLPAAPTAALGKVKRRR